MGYIGKTPTYVSSAKGSDIASATTITIDGSSGYFDVTGTTTITGMTVDADRAFSLQFDGVLTLTHGSSLVLPNDANITTAVGDIVTFQSVGADSVIAISVTKADGTAVVGGGAWTLIGTQEASNDASLTQTGLDSTYDTYAIVISDMVPATDATKITVRFGDSSGVDSAASDYQYHFSQSDAASGAYVGDGQTLAEIRLSQCGNAAGEGCGAMLFLHRPADGTTRPFLSGTHASIDESSLVQGGHVFGARTAVITLDRIQIIAQSGNLSTGRFSVYGVSHA